MPLASDLAAFRAARPLRRLEHAGTAWRYLRSGIGSVPLLLLGGALGEADFGFRTIALLERDFTVVAADYPPVRSLGDAVDGIAAILAAEAIARVHVVGGSFGGVVAQAFAARRPEAVASLTLSHTGPPHRRRLAKPAAAALSILPGAWLRALFRRRVRKAVAPAGAEWLALFDESVGRLGKAEILSRVRVAAEFRAGRRYGRQLSGFPVMILSASDDPLIGRSAADELARLYPGAERHEFTGTGHLAAVLRPEAFAGQVREFILRGAAERQGSER